MKKHELKIWPEYCAAVLDGRKTFEARTNDRDFAVGDFLKLREFDPIREMYLNNELLVRVTYLMDTPRFCAPGVVIMGIRLVTPDDLAQYNAANL